MVPPRQRRLFNPPNSPAVGDNDAPLDEDVGDMEDLEATDAPSTSRASSDAAASASATTVVTFNGAKYTSWQAALVTLTRLNLHLAVELLQPFCDMIHQIEGDRPALGRCFVGLRDLDLHVKACVEKHELAAPHISSGADTLLATWRRRYINEGGAQVQKLLDPSYVLTFLLDPLYADVSGATAQLPRVSPEMEEVAKGEALRIGGQAAVDELVVQLLKGWPASCQDAVRACTQSTEVSFGAGAAKRKRNEVADLVMRKGVWTRYGTDHMPKLTEVALRMLCCHPTSCAAERNWSLWAKVFLASRSALALERGRKLITFCFNHRARNADLSDFDLTLAVVEGSEDV